MSNNTIILRTFGVHRNEDVTLNGHDFKNGKLEISGISAKKVKNLLARFYDVCEEENYKIKCKEYDEKLNKEHGKEKDKTEQDVNKNLKTELTEKEKNEAKNNKNTKTEPIKTESAKTEGEEENMNGGEDGLETKTEKSQTSEGAGKESNAGNDNKGKNNKIGDKK